MKHIIFLIFIGSLVSCSKSTSRFERLAAETTGIAFVNSIVEHDTFNIMHNEYMYNGGGVGIGDLNNDGLQDIVFSGNQVSSQVYLNMGGFKFQDITNQFKGLSNEQWYSGVVMADVNGDGLLDLYMTSTNSIDPANRKNRLWINQGIDAKGLPSFIEKAEEYGVADVGYSVHAGFFDYDLDGDLDLYVLNNVVYKTVPTNYRPKIADGTSINNDHLYRNNGDGTFTDVSFDAGIIYEGYGLGLAIGDINKDGYPDIYVSNDYIANDILYINQQDGTFKNVSKEYLSYQSRFSMGNDMADINNDGNPEVMTTDMLPEQYFRKKQTINGNSYNVYVNNKKFSYEPQFVRNMLHIHNGFVNGELLPLSEVGQLAGIYQTEWSWSPLFADFDNDGDRDLMVTNGFPKDLTDKDFTNYKAQVYGFVAGDEHIISKIPIVKVSNYAYENVGDYQFKDQTEAWGLNIPSFSNGAAFADLDNDGDLDYVVNNIDDAAFVYRNLTIEKIDKKSNYVRIKLKGNAPNTMAIGAKVELWSNGNYQFYEQFLSRGYISSIDPLIHFGLKSTGDKKLIIDSIRVTWPLGNKQVVLKALTPNQLITIDESDAVPSTVSSRSVDRQLLFQKENDLIEFLHLEEDFIDFFQSQRIIHRKFSQLGPCMALGDIDNDGNQDIVIGASDKLPTMVYLNKGGRFEIANYPGLTDSKKCSESDLIVLDIDGDGDNDLVALAGGYANQNEEEYRHYLYRNDKGVFTREELQLPPFPASVVRAADFDGDGDLDLFVAARVKRGSFPFAHASYVLVNDKGTLKTSPELTFELGMVTDAVWSDYDMDGSVDLIITREWNSVTILKNKAGKGFEQVRLPNVEQKHGFWFSIAAADLDNDGDDDYVIGNLGENHRFNVSDKFPMGLYAIDVDNNGIIDPITTAYWKDKKGVMQEYPVNYFDELASQSPFFLKKFTSYTAFSFATIDSILHKESVPKNNKFHINTTSSYILWNDKGKFTWERLPTVAQSSPVRKMLIKDFNADGIVDILVAGNDYSYDVSTGYYDANKGILLMGKGNKAFSVLPPSQSGLILKGQVNSLLYLDGDSPLLIGGINRDSLAVFRNITKKETKKPLP